MTKLGVVEDNAVCPHAGQDLCQRVLPADPVRSKGAGTEKETAFQPAGAGRTEPAYSAGLRRPVRQYGSVHPGLSGAQAGRCDRPAGLWPGDGLLPLRQWKVALVCRGSAPCGGVPARAAAGAGARDLSRRRRLCRGLDQADPRRCAGCYIFWSPPGGLFHLF